MKNINTLSVVILLLSPIVIWSAIEPHSRELWIAETLPMFIGVFVIVKIHKAFPLTDFGCFMIFIGAALMLIGAHYSYSYVPIGEWAKSFFELERNNYDKIGHFFQGFIVAIIIKEIIFRKALVNSIIWTNLFVVSFAIALSAIWEIVEWIMVVILIYFDAKRPASDFLGTQNYIWDAQSDILFATVGAMIAILIFGKYHEEKIKQLLSTKDSL